MVGKINMKDKDYEQLYYDALYENKQLKNKIKELETEIQDLNRCRTKRNIDLQKYIMLQMKKKKIDLSHREMERIK